MRFLDTITNPVLWRGIERLFIVSVTATFGWMGHRLFMFGITEGQARLSAQGDYYKIIFSGTAPGLFLMVVAGVALLTALWKSGVRASTRGDKKDERSGNDTARAMPPPLQGHEPIEHSKQKAEGRKATVILAARDWIGAGKQHSETETDIIAQPNRGRLFSRIAEIKGAQRHVEHMIQQIEQEKRGRLRPDAKEKIRRAEEALISGGELIIEIEEDTHEPPALAGALIAEIEEETRTEGLKKKLRPIFSNKP